MKYLYHLMGCFFLMLTFLLFYPLSIDAHKNISAGASGNLSNNQGAIPSIHPLMATYDVYVGGLHLVTADILFEEQKGKYHTHVKAHTTDGFWYKLFPWDTVLDTVGSIKKDHFLPTYFKTTDDWNHHPKTTELKFTKNGDVSPFFDPPNKDVNREIVTPEQRSHSLDPVTGLLQMLAQVAAHDNCNITVPIFDGKRLFDITGIDHGFENIDDGEYSAYNGDTRVCGAEFKMVAGEWKEKNHIQNGFWQRNDKDLGRDPFEIWVARISPELPELPVRLRGGSVWGLIVMHLSEWHYVDINK